jgi:hypothetical protein
MLFVAIMEPRETFVGIVGRVMGQPNEKGCCWR